MDIQISGHGGSRTVSGQLQLDTIPLGITGALATGIQTFQGDMAQRLIVTRYAQGRRGARLLPLSELRHL